MPSQIQYADHKVVGKLLSTKLLMQALKAISLEENCTFQITSEGIKVTVEYSKFLQANLFVNALCFEEFKVPEDDIITFSVNLNVTAECLGIFSGGFLFLIDLKGCLPSATKVWNGFGNSSYYVGLLQIQRTYRACLELP